VLGRFYGQEILGGSFPTVTAEKLSKHLCSTSTFLIWINTSWIQCQQINTLVALTFLLYYYVLLLLPVSWKCQSKYILLLLLCTVQSDIWILLCTNLPRACSVKVFRTFCWTFIWVLQWNFQITLCKISSVTVNSVHPFLEIPPEVDPGSVEFVTYAAELTIVQRSFETNSNFSSVNEGWVQLMIVNFQLTISSNTVC